MLHKSTSLSTVPLIDTPLQRGVSAGAREENRFNGFHGGLKTAEAVKTVSPSSDTPLKRGVNERVPSDNHAAMKLSC